MCETPVLGCEKGYKYNTTERTYIDKPYPKCIHYYTSAMHFTDYDFVDIENLEDMFSNLQCQYKGVYEVLPCNTDNKIKMYFDFDFPKIKPKTKEPISVEQAIDDIKHTYSELKMLTKWFGRYVLQGYTSIPGCKTKTGLRLQYHDNNHKYASFHVVFYETMIHKDDLYDLIKSNIILQHADRSVYKQCSGIQLFRHMNSLKIPVLSTPKNKLSIKHISENNEYEFTYLKNSITNEFKTKYVLDFVCDKYYDENGIEDQSLITKSFVTITENDIKNTNFLDVTQDYLANRCDFCVHFMSHVDYKKCEDVNIIQYTTVPDEIRKMKTMNKLHNIDMYAYNINNFTDKDIFEDERYLNALEEYFPDWLSYVDGIKSDNNSKTVNEPKPIQFPTLTTSNNAPDTTILEENDIENDDLKSCLPDKDMLFSYLKDFSAISYESGNKEYDFDKYISYNALASYVFILICKCPYTENDLSEVLYKWWNLRDHASGDENLENVLNKYNYEQSSECFFKMLHHMPCEKIRKYWYMKLKHLNSQDIVKHPYNKPKSYNDLIKNIEYNCYIENTKEGSKLLNNELISDMKDVISMTRTAPIMYFIKQKCHKTEYKVLDNETNKLVSHYENNYYYSQLSSAEVEKTLKKYIVFVEKREKKKDKKISLYDIIMNNKSTFSKSNVTFYSNDPDEISYFTGYNFEDKTPNLDNIAVFLNMVYKIICSSDIRIYKWLVDWISYIIQNPCGKTKCKIVISGSQGIGKNYFTDTICRILGHYANSNITDLNQIVGTFNSAACNKKLIVCNEIASSSSKKYYDVDALKAFDTQDTIMMNEKNEKIIEIPNVCNLIITTNHHFLNNIEIDDRRDLYLSPTWYFEDAQTKKNYFDKMWGLTYDKTFMTDLYNFFYKRDITTFRVGSPPPTTNLKVQQKLGNISEFQSFILSSTCPYEGYHDNSPEYSYRDILKNCNIFELFSHPTYGIHRSDLLEHYNKFLKSIKSTTTVNERNIMNLFSNHCEIRRKVINGYRHSFVALKRNFLNHYVEMYKSLTQDKTVELDEYNDNSEPDTIEMSINELNNCDFSKLFTKEEVLLFKYTK